MTVSKLTNLVNEILEYHDITTFEAMQIAVQMYQCELYSEANVLGMNNVPSAMERIAMELEGLKDAVGQIEIR